MNKPLHSAWVTHFEALESELNALDAATGDGDHGATMLKGLKAVANSDERPAKAFRKAAGGASGTLFSVLVGALDTAASQPDEFPQSLSVALTQAAEKISELGQAVAGDKTMLDALLPAASAASLPDALNAALDAARAGYVQTESMTAKRGRARHVEGAGLGYRDAGARSVVELLVVLLESSHPKHLTAEPTTQR